MNKQGGTEETVYFPEGEARNFRSEAERTFGFYRGKIEGGMRRELARINLPLSTYTEWYWKIDLHNLFHFLRLRLDSHAQYEIRVFAEAIADFVKEQCPASWEAFEDYYLHAIRLSRTEVTALRAMLTSAKPDWEELGSGEWNKRELEEYRAKLIRLGAA